MSTRCIRVAVVDTGVGPHSALKVKRGLNTTAAESGLIASAAAGWRRGEASAVAAAIKDAANQSCDLVNLSLGDSMADDGIRDAVGRADPGGINTPTETAFARQVATELVGTERVTPQGRGEGGCMVHNPCYDFNDNNSTLGWAHSCGSGTSFARIVSGRSPK